MKARSGIAALGFTALVSSAGAQEMERTELQRHDLTGTNMEVIVSIIEAPPGATLPRHVHSGEEAFYVLEGAQIQLPGKEPVPLPAGASGINVRDVPHSGFKVVGGKPLKLLTVHVVDKGKALYGPAK